MAKMTEEQKQRARENLARAREAKKAKAAEEAAKAAEAVAVAAQPVRVDSSTVSDHDIERSAREVEKATIAAFKADELVPYVIPLEQGAEESDQVYARSYNGVFYNLKRGEQVMIPKGYANHIDRRLRLAREGEKRVADFTSKTGKRF